MHDLDFNQSDPAFDSPYTRGVRPSPMALSSAAERQRLRKQQFESPLMDGVAEGEEGKDEGEDVMALRIQGGYRSRAARRRVVSLRDDRDASVRREVKQRQEQEALEAEKAAEAAKAAEAEKVAEAAKAVEAAEVAKAAKAAAEAVEAAAHVARSVAALPCITYRPLGVLQCAAGGDNTVIAEHVPTLVRKDNLSLLGDYCGEQRVKFTCVALERRATVQQSPPAAAVAAVAVVAVVAAAGGRGSSGGKVKAAAAVRCWSGRKRRGIGKVRSQDVGGPCRNKPQAVCFRSLAELTIENPPISSTFTFGGTETAGMEAAGAEAAGAEAAGAEAAGTKGEGEVRVTPLLLLLLLPPLKPLPLQSSCFLISSPA